VGEGLGRGGLAVSSPLNGGRTALPPSP
jgi:hypothetical protein